MNLLPARAWIAILSITIVTISCKKGSDDISGTVQPRNEVLSTYYTDSLNIRTSTFLLDEELIRTDNSLRTLVGSADDPIFGKINVTSFARFESFKYLSTLGPNTKLDSIKVLVILNRPGVNAFPSPYYTYGRPDIQKISFYRLEKAIERDSSYNITSSLSTSSLLGIIDINPKSTETYGKISNSFGEELIANPSYFKDKATFQENFKGISLVGDPSNNAVIGILDMYFILYFHNYYALNNLKERDSIYMNISNETSYRFSNIKTDRNRTRLQGLTKGGKPITNEPKDGLCFIQNNTGVGTKITFPTLEAFKKSINGKILINRAELEIFPLQDDTTNFNLPTIIKAFELDESGVKVQKEKLPSNSDSTFKYIENESAGNALCSYDKTSKSYKFLLTKYFQSILDGKSKNKSPQTILFCIYFC